MALPVPDGMATPLAIFHPSTISSITERQEGYCPHVWDTKFPSIFADKVEIV